jgi:hypothetical protein
MPGVFRYRPSSPPENPVSSAPATAVGTKGVSNAPPIAISAVESPLTNCSGGTDFRNG